MKYYTWKDVERKLYINKNLWGKEIVDIEVYSSEIVVKINNREKHNEVRKHLSEILEKNIEDDKLELDLQGSYLEVSYEESEQTKKDVIVPLFRRVLYRDSAYKEEMLEKELEGKPVIAFHSYKGGVGWKQKIQAF